MRTLLADAVMAVRAGWIAARTRLLCPRQQVTRYNGGGGSENAASYSCH